mmetsp:Transcript_26376/g.40478  ORF Transcript_26376/g.40478 Transcript_26376/m.40478 type:complete len:473 (-) Transcript_26376:1028-2446(-)
MEEDNVTNDSFCASSNLKLQWDSCCAKALGIDPNHEILTPEFSSSLSPSYDEDPVPVLFLLSDNVTDEHDDDECMSSSFESDNPHNDPWLENCVAISKGLDQMSGLIQRKRRAYTRVINLSFRGAEEENMTDQERSVLESTVLSFAATTGNQIESLRQSIPPNTGSDVDSHRAGIVSCLLLRLRQEVADPMTKLQKARSKRAVTVWNDPLHCELVSYQPTNNKVNPQNRADDSAWDAALNEVSMEDPRFIPSGPGPMPADSNGWVTAYNDIVFEGTSTQQPVQRPPSKWIHPRLQQTEPISEDSPPISAHESPRIKFSAIAEGDEATMPYQEQHQVAKPPPVAPMPHINNASIDDVTKNRRDDEYDDALMIERESAMLLQKVQNEDLENIQKVEAGMTQITSLLSQFSNLVSEQQQEIHTIHEQAKSSKDNVTKGQNSLVDATERTKQSKHYMATFIAILAVVLMFFNTVSP